MELDHVFVLCEADGPEAATLSRFGLTEGSGNTHPGQGTACRRFFFRNSYLELLWVHDPAQAQSQPALSTRIWDRWSARGEGACPFGIAFRPSFDWETRPPFPTWAYSPSYLPAGLAIDFAIDTPLTEPEFFYIGFQRGRARAGKEPDSHAIPAMTMTNLRIGGPAAGPRSRAAQSLEATGLLSFESSSEPVLRLGFDHETGGKTADLRPELPLVLQW